MGKKVLTTAEWTIFKKALLDPKLDNNQKIKFLEKYDINAVHEADGRTLLIEACGQHVNNGRIFAEILEFLLAQGADPNQADNKGRSAIFLAAHYNTQLTKLLVEHGGNVNYLSPVEEFNYSLLCAASVNGHQTIVDYLLEKKADPNLKGEIAGEAPLHGAVSRGSCPGIIKSLLRAGAQVDIRTLRQQTPLYIAAEGGFLENARLLLEAKADPEAVQINNFSALYNIVDKAKERFDKNLNDLILLLLRHGADINRLNGVGVPALLPAILNRNLPLVRLLLAQKADPRIPVKIANTGPSRLQLLARTQPHTVPDSSIEQGLEHKTEAQPQFPDTTPAPQTASSTASMIGPLLELLKEQKFHRGRPGIYPFLMSCEEKHISTTTLHVAASTGYPEIITALLDAKAEISAGDQLGMTPLHVACFNDLAQTAELLIKRGADLVATNKVDSTPLHLAVQGGCATTTSLLLKRLKKPALNAKDNIGTTALHQAALVGNLELVKLLVTAGASVNNVTDEGVTTLFLAALRGYDKIVTYLLSQGADPDILRHDGASPLSMAHQNKHPATVDALLRFYCRNTLKDKSYKGHWVKNLSSHTLCIIPILEKAAITDVILQTSFTQSGRTFLTERGFTAEQIRTLQEELKHASADDEKEITETKETKEEKIIQWWNGRINNYTPRVISISSDSSPHCFFYLAIQNIGAQGCGEAKSLAFQEITPRFCATENEQGLKKLKEPIPVQIQTEHDLETVYLTYELKGLRKQLNGARVLCFEKLAADGHSTLIVGAVYAAKGLHADGEASKFAGRTFPLHLPLSLEQHTIEVAKLLGTFGLSKAPTYKGLITAPTNTILEYCDWSPPKMS